MKTLATLIVVPFSFIIGGPVGPTYSPSDPTPSLSAQEEVIPEHNYIGVDRCGNSRCHGSERLGNQYAVWESSDHAHAYQTLASSEALAIGQERGIANPQESEECLRCHMTAYNVPLEYRRESFDQTRGVQCESCHGPGADYSPIRIMRNRDEAIANGLLIPNEETCRACHNEESPSYREFNFDDYFARIRHPRPEGEGTE